MPQQMGSDLGPGWLSALGGGLGGLSQMLAGLSAREQAAKAQQVVNRREDAQHAQTQQNWQNTFDEGNRRANVNELANSAQVAYSHGRDANLDKEKRIGQAVDVAKGIGAGGAVSPELAAILEGSPYEAIFNKSTAPLKAAGKQAVIPGGPEMDSYALPTSPQQFTKRTTPEDLATEVDRDMKKWQFEQTQTAAGRLAGDYEQKQALLERLKTPGYQLTATDMMLSGLRNSDTESMADKDAREVRKANAISEGNARSQAAHREPKSMTPGQEANYVLQLGKQWQMASKTSRDLDNSVKLMNVGLQAAKDGNLNAGSQAILITFQKILDPTSVVKESEYERSGQGLALRTRVAGYMERLSKGGAGVPYAELVKIAKLASDAADAQRSTLPDTQKRFGLMADRYNIPNELIFDQPMAATNQPVPQASIDLLKDAKDGRYTLTDGSVVEKRGGVYTRGQ